MRFIFLVLCCYPLSLFSLPARDARGNHTQNFLHLQGKVSIKLSKAHYHFGDEIALTFSVTNTGKEAVRIYPVEKDFTTFQIVVTDENDEKARRMDDMKLQSSVVSRKSSIVNLAGDAVKEIILNSDETYSKKLQLTDLFDLKPGKKYFVQGYFYPKFQEENLFLKSRNTAFFHLEKRKEEQFVPKLPSGDLNAEGISPEETIFLFLAAEMKKNWENYFKYINFNDYILSYDRFSREFTDSEPESKQVVIESFKRYLTESKSGTLKYYKVISANKINSSISKVNVYIEREQDRVPARYEYQYTLKKSDENQSQFWKISNLIVKVRK